jgi:hypothetical protein
METSEKVQTGGDQQKWNFGGESPIKIGGS